MRGRKQEQNLQGALEEGIGSSAARSCCFGFGLHLTDIYDSIIGIGSMSSGKCCATLMIRERIMAA